MYYFMDTPTNLKIVADDKKCCKDILEFIDLHLL